MPQQPPRDRALDGLRGLAVLLVYIFHYAGGLASTNPLIHFLGNVAAAGWVGVVVFFALSGFLITGILWDTLGQPHQLRNFYARRALRILPLYYAALALCAFVSIATGARFSEISGLLYFIPFLQNIPWIIDRAFNGWYTLPIYHLWSLAVEEQFYLLWPALLLLAKTRSRALNLSLWTFALCAAFRLLIWGPLYSDYLARQLHQFPLVHGGALALGAALALALRAPVENTDWTRINRYAWPAFLTGLATYIFTSISTHSYYLTPRLQHIFGLAGVSVAAAALIPLALRPGAVRSICSAAPLAFLGPISYGFYVFHLLLQPVFDTLGAHLAHADKGTPYHLYRLATALPITIVISWLSYKLLEQPILRHKRSFPQ